jgi:4-hydroxybenzoate polyprenyltransferase
MSVTATRSSIREQLLGVLLVTHPIPSAMYVVGMGLFSWLAAVAAHHSIAPGRLVLLLAGVACAEIAIGATNDVRDLALDSVSRPEKPIVRGWITARQAAILAWAAAAGVFIFMTPLGLVPLILCLLIEALGLAYDFGLKGTPFSALLFAGWFPLIPLLAWDVSGKYQRFLPWLVPLGALLGVAMNVANSLPDLEDDLAHGVGGLPHLLGMRLSLAAAWGLPLVTLALIWLLDLTSAVPAHLPWMLLATAASLLSVGLAAALFVRRPEPATLRTTFIIQALGVVGLGTGWLAAVAF